MRKARVSLPGGCAIGTRPVDLHLMGLKALGAEIDIDGGYVLIRAPNGLRGARITFPKVSVGATHNVMMAASLAKGETLIENAACEPEVGDVAECLVKMGARIDGIGTPTLRIEGRDRLEGATHTVLPDRIETGTFAFAVAATGGEIVLEGARKPLVEAALAALEQAGVSVAEVDGGIRVMRNGSAIEPIERIETQPFPGFPTDLQAQLMALVTRARGTSTIRETIFENRFMHVQELARLGADIHLHGDTATVHGVKRLRGAQVMATDLRASVSLVIAALMAEGETTINRVYHLDRGFERLEAKLASCGADIERITG
jgi:UDP-N-acetylglucosamine 1-carboxyvinyltransferase